MAATDTLRSPFLHVSVTRCFAFTATSAGLSAFAGWPAGVAWRNTGRVSFRSPFTLTVTFICVRPSFTAPPAGTTARSTASAAATAGSFTATGCTTSMNRSSGGVPSRRISSCRAASSTASADSSAPLPGGRSPKVKSASSNPANLSR